MNIQIYGKSKCFDTRKAERWFKERRIKYQYVDLPRYGMGRRELENVRSAVGAENLLDRKNPEVLSHPAAYNGDPDYILETLAENPRFLRTPIVRNGEQVTLGADETAWEAWIQKG